MPDIIIKDENGNDETYTDVSTVKFKAPGGATVSYQYNPGTDYPWKTGDYRVRFIDYDGNVLKVQWVDAGDGVSYPSENPRHEGLTFVGWNYSQAQLSEINGNIDVGAIYTSATTTAAEGHTSNIFVFRCRTGRLNVRVNGYYNGANTFEIDWGDGTVETKTVSSTSSQTYGVNFYYNHTYAAEGTYTVTFTKTAGAGDYWWGYYATTSYSGEYYNVCGATNSANLLAFTCGKAVTKIGSSAFCNCYSLQNVIIPEGVTSIRNYAFYTCCSLQSVNIPDSVTSIEKNVFYNCYSLQSVIIPDSVTSIGENTFYNCYSLQSVSIPDSVTSIGENTFYYCYSLQSVIIPDSVTSIGASAFYYCYSLLDLYVKATTPPTYGSSALSGIQAAILIHVPSGSVAAYKSASGWSSYANYIVGY